MSRPRPLRLATLALVLPLTLFAQAPSPLDDPAFQEILENIAKRNALNPDFDAHQLVEHLDNLLDNPLDPNLAERSELENLWLLSEAQIQSFFEYREKLGPFLSIEELQAVPGWGMDDTRAVRPFFKTQTSFDDWNGKRKSLIFNGKDDLRLRASYRTDNQNPDEKKFAGPPVGLLVRYRHTLGSRVSWGFAADSDPGERLFQKENRQGFDFYSGHFFVKNWSKTVKAVALGDFKTNFGQGLVLASGFSLGKSSNSILIKKTDAPIRPHTAGGEDFFQRGAAFTLSKRHWEGTAFASHRRRDAAVFAQQDTLDGFDDEDAFANFEVGGLHRLPAEIDGEKTVGESLFGASIHREKDRLRVGLNSLAARFSRPLAEGGFDKNGHKSFIFNSLDYTGGWKNLLFFGETALDGSGGTASINSALFSLDRRVTMAVAHRIYGGNYRPLYSAAFGETREAKNERGLYTGIEWRPRARLKLNGFLDFWRHPLPRADSKGASSGREWLASATFFVRKTGQVQAILRHETHEKWSETGHFSEHKWRLRLQSNWKMARFVEWRGRGEATRFRDGEAHEMPGFLAFQEVRWQPLGRFFSGAVRLTAFETSGTEVRMYSFESQLLDSQLIPSFSGKGTRLAFRGDFRLGRGSEIGLFFAKISYVQPENRRVWEVRAQARWVF